MYVNLHFPCGLAIVTKNKLLSLRARDILGDGWKRMNETEIVALWNSIEVEQRGVEVGLRECFTFRRKCQVKYRLEGQEKPSWYSIFRKSEIGQQVIQVSRILEDSELWYSRDEFIEEAETIVKSRVNAVDHFYPIRPEPNYLEFLEYFNEENLEKCHQTAPEGESSAELQARLFELEIQDGNCIDAYLDHRWDVESGSWIEQTSSLLRLDEHIIETRELGRIDPSALESLSISVHGNMFRDGAVALDNFSGARVSEPHIVAVIAEKVFAGDDLQRLLNVVRSTS